MDSSNRVIATGLTTAIRNPGILTVAYDTSGNRLWVKNLQSGSSTYDYGVRLHVNASSSVGIAGYSRGVFTSDDDLTALINNSGNIKWTRRFNSGTSPSDAVSLDVDPGGNHMAEIGEMPAIVFAWTNSSASAITMTGTLPRLWAPLPFAFPILDAMADYGILPPDADPPVDCLSATGNCYGLDLSLTGTLPRLHLDIRVDEETSTGALSPWIVHVGPSFTDVTPTHIFYEFVEGMIHHGITSGCSTTEYCPDNPTLRWQMAIFIARAMTGGDEFIPSSGTVNSQPYSCVSGGTSIFNDVLPTDPACAHIHFIASQNVTLGCGASLYCPNATVRRDQMAAFIARAIAGGDAAVRICVAGSYDCSAGGFSNFADGAPGSAFCKHINYLFYLGVVSGCGGGNYCPVDPVTRGQMSKFIVNAFSLFANGFH